MSFLFHSFLGKGWVDRELTVYIKTGVPLSYSTGAMASSLAPKKDMEIAKR